MVHPEQGPLTFADFHVGRSDVRAIGVVPNHDTVLREIARAFDASLGNLEQMIRVVAPHKTLQDNVAHADKLLSSPRVQRKVGYEDVNDPALLARLGYAPNERPPEAMTSRIIAADWVVRSGLQTQVFRPFTRPLRSGEQLPEQFDAALMPGRVARWLVRSSELVLDVAENKAPIDCALLASTPREMAAGEYQDIEAGTAENTFMATELVPRLARGFGIGAVEMLASDSLKGEDVMSECALRIGDKADITEAKILIPAVAGNWMQSGAQARTAFRCHEDTFDNDLEHPQLWVASDTFPVDHIGDKTPAEAQNALSAIGNILRGAKLLDDLR